MEKTSTNSSLNKANRSPSNRKPKSDLSSGKKQRTVDSEKSVTKLTLPAADKLSVISFSAHLPDYNLATQTQMKVRNDPEWFLREWLGQQPWEMEIAMIESVRDYMKTLLAGCVASGKTHATAGLVFWWLCAFFPARVFSIAPTERQLKVNLWSEIPSMHASARVKLGGELNTLSFKLGDKWYARGFSPKDKFGVFGMHGEHDLILIDDGQGVAQEVFDGLENAMAGGTSRMLVSCNPIVTSGEIYNAMTRNRGEYNVIRISADKNEPPAKNVFIAPNIAAQSVVVPGTITQDMVDKWSTKYGWDSDFVRTKARALLPKQEPDTLIPLDWIELANCRDIPAGDHITTLGCDIARFGDDDTVLFPVKGRQGLQPVTIHGNDTMQVTGHIVRAISDYNVRDVFIDVIGIGSGVYDRLAELQREEKPTVPKHVRLYAVNVGEKAKNEEKFVNLRSETWWAARESLNPKGEAPFALPQNEELMAELAAPKYTVESGGRIKVESKEDMKDRLGRSPDLADAYCLAVFKRFQNSSKPAAAVFGGNTSAGFPGMQRTADWM